MEIAHIYFAQSCWRVTTHSYCANNFIDNMELHFKSLRNIDRSMNRSIIKSYEK